MSNENVFQGGGTTAAKSEIERGTREAKSAADDLKSAGAAVAGNYRDKAEQAWGDAKAQARTWQEDAEDYVRENPTKTVLMMLGAGFVLGVIFRR